MPGKLEATGVNVLGLLHLLLVFAVAFCPLLLLRRGSRGDPPGSDSDDGPGNQPRRPPRPPGAPRGGIPLPDAEPARVRLRDHRRPWENRQRRRAHEPDRPPARTIR